MRRRLRRLFTFPPASRRLSENYRKKVEAGSITSYAQLIVEMVKAEKNNMIIKKKNYNVSLLGGIPTREDPKNKNAQGGNRNNNNNRAGHGKKRGAENCGSQGRGRRSSKKPRSDAYKGKLAIRESHKAETEDPDSRALAVTEPASINNIAAATVKIEKAEQPPAAAASFSRPMFQATATATSTSVTAPAAINGVLGVAPGYVFTGSMHPYYPNSSAGYSSNHGQLSMPSYYDPEQFRMANSVGYNGGINQPCTCPPPISYEPKPPGVGP